MFFFLPFNLSSHQQTPLVMASRKATAKAQPGPASKADKSGAKGRSKVASKQKSPSGESPLCS